MVSRNKAATATVKPVKPSPAKVSPAKLKLDKPIVEEPKPRPAEPRMAIEHQATTNDPMAKLTLPLRSQGLLPADMELKDACTHFEALSDCVAALHASHNLGINFNCMKWDLTGVPLTADPASCATPGSRNLMSLSKAIQALKPDSFGKEEAINAQKQADNDLKAAGLDSFSRAPR